MAMLPAILARPRLHLFSGVIALGLIQAVSLICLAWVTQAFLSQVLSDAPVMDYRLLAALIGLALVSAGCRWAERTTAERLGNHYVHELRMRLFDTLVRSSSTGPTARPSRRQGGVHMVRFTSDLNAIRQWVSLGLARMVSASLFLTGVVIALAVMDLTTALTVCATLLVSLVVITLLGIGLERGVRATRRVRGQLANAVSAIVSTVGHLAAFGRTPKERKRLGRKSEELGRALEQRAFWIGSLHAFTDFAHRTVMIVALIGGSVALQNGQLTIAALLAILGVTALVGAPLRDLGRVFEYYKNNRVAREKLTAFLNTDTRQGFSTKSLPEGNGRLTFRDVAVRDLLHIDRLSVPAGQRVALVGENGSGKSTLLQLILGLQIPDAGRIRLDGVDTRRLSHADRRRAMGIAGHQLPLVLGSIDKNIRYRHPQASADQVAAACAHTGMGSKILHLPRGLNTRLGLAGDGLSEGEAARVKLARAVLGEPRLLLLDEIESGLDQDGRQVLTALLRNYPGTIIFATHDPRLLRYADRLWTIKDGALISASQKKSRQEAAA